MNYLKKLQLHYLQGGNFIVLVRLLIDNKFMISFRQIPKVFVLLISNILNIPFVLLQKIFFFNKIKNIEIKKDPIFILGHWRSGTTFLSNLMTRDPQFGYFNILQTYHPSTYILLKPFMHILGKKVIPKQRPMDNIKIALDLPQEEDYAVANRSLYSMIHFIAFPRNFDKYYFKFGLFENIGKKQYNRWKRIYISELKKATYVAKGKQLVVKTPINTGRVKQILEIFPNAKFIHISRNPYKTCLSTQKMYKNFFPIYDLQYIADDDELENTQYKVYEALYKKYFREKELIPDGNLVEIKYEDFVKKPLQHIQQIYNDLDLSSYKDAEEKFTTYIDGEKKYKPNSYAYDKKKLARIRERLSFAFDGLDYPDEFI